MIKVIIGLAICIAFPPVGAIIVALLIYSWWTED